MPNFLIAAANSADNLAQVQAGFTSPRKVDFSDLKIVLIVLGALILLGAAGAIIGWRRRVARRKKMGWSSVTNPQHIWEILTKALSRQAQVTLELYHNNRNVTHKGTLSAIENDSRLVISLAESPGAGAEFKDLPGIVHLNFRSSLKDPLEHYQFTTHIDEGRYAKVKEDWREFQLLTPVPKILTSAQRRSFLRMEPTPPFEVTCALHQVPEDSFPDLESLEEVTSGKIQDLSIGGAQMMIPASVSLKETQRFAGIMELPVKELDVEIANPTLVLLIQLLSQEPLESALGTGPPTQKILRLRFLGRYLHDTVTKTWNYRGLTQISMDDLSYWLQAYQRHIIKKRLNLLPPDINIRPPNMFPSHPPERPPKKDD
ncbi:MAG: hypothetical protein LBF41_04200 [Deltaproteobacteria bacterium]|jgi:hypothetical protein|nr:hypothetical protein [Deltaproteobacteria bacterium]